MFNKNRIRLLIALGVILIIGAFIVVNNLRPVSERKRNKQEKIDSKKELENALKSIKSLTDSISENSKNQMLLIKRAKKYKSINKFDEAIKDLKIVINSASDSKVKEIAQKELQSCENIKAHLDRLKN